MLLLMPTLGAFGVNCNGCTEISSISGTGHFWVASLIHVASHRLETTLDLNATRAFFYRIQLFAPAPEISTTQSGIADSYGSGGLQARVGPVEVHKYVGSDPTRYHPTAPLWYDLREGDYWVVVWAAGDIIDWHVAIGADSPGTTVLITREGKETTLWNATTMPTTVGASARAGPSVGVVAGGSASFTVQHQLLGMFSYLPNGAAYLSTPTGDVVPCPCNQANTFGGENTPPPGPPGSYTYSWNGASAPWDVHAAWADIDLSR